MKQRYLKRGLVAAVAGAVGLWSVALVTDLTGLVGAARASAEGQRVSVTGEIIDTWCYTTEIMYSLGTAHHQCAIWCAVGGVPVSVAGSDGKVYVVLRVEDEDQNVAAPRVIKIQTHEVSVEGDLYVRDGVNYLMVSQVADDKGVINLTHEDYGIQPFGN